MTFLFSLIKTPAARALALGALLAAAALLGAWALHRHTRQAWEQGAAAGRAEVQAQWAAERERQLHAAAAAAQQNQQKKEINDARVITAQNQRTSAQAASGAAYQRLAVERDGLRRDLNHALDTIRACGAAMPAPAAHAAGDAAAALADVLADMEAAGAAMAGAADGHAADALMYQQAWPR